MSLAFFSVLWKQKEECGFHESFLSTSNARAGRLSIMPSAEINMACIMEIRWDKRFESAKNYKKSQIGVWDKTERRVWALTQIRNLKCSNVRFEGYPLTV